MIARVIITMMMMMKKIMMMIMIMKMMIMMKQNNTPKATIKSQPMNLNTVISCTELFSQRTRRITDADVHLRARGCESNGQVEGGLVV